jgi:hypothetical protein
VRSSFLINKNLRKIVSSYSALHLSSVSYSMDQYSVHNSVVDQNRFDTDPETIFHVDAYPDPTQVLNRLTIGNFFYFLYSQQCRCTLFYPSRQCHRCHSFQYFGQFRELDTRISICQILCRTSRIRIHNAAVQLYMINSSLLTVTILTRYKDETVRYRYQVNVSCAVVLRIPWNL